MSGETIKERLTAAMKDAMRAKEKKRLGTIRMVLAAIKRVEVDERVEVEDDRVIAIIEKLLKQSRDSLVHFEEAGREDLIAKEKADVEVYQEFMPAQLGGDEIGDLVDRAISESGASSMKDMGAVMKILKPELAGRADMGMVSGLVRQKLNA